MGQKVFSEKTEKNHRPAGAARGGEQLKKAVAASPLAGQKYVEEKPSSPVADSEDEDTPDSTDDR